ncbi:MAG: DUF2520 domain-containing protein [Ferruginibacter sp.]
MKITLIGSGNVATILGTLMKKNGHEVLQVISRNITHAHILATPLGAAASDYKTQPDERSEVVIFAVNDDVLTNNSHHFQMHNALVVHTAGAAPMKILEKYSDNYGVLYPLQSLNKQAPPKDDIPFLTDASSTDNLIMINALAESLSDSVHYADDHQRLVLHTAAVVVNNFTNHLYDLAEDFCRNEFVDFKLLLPLILETGNRLQTHSPAELQTGPAIRKDIHTLDLHLRKLALYPHLRTMYLRMTDSIMNP